MLTKILKDKTAPEYHILMKHMPLLAGNDAKTVLGFADLKDYPVLTTTELIFADKLLAGTAFDIYQRYLITGEWDYRYFEKLDRYIGADYPIFTKLLKWVRSENSLSPSARAVLFGHIEQYGRSGPPMEGSRYYHLLGVSSADEYVKEMSVSVAQDIEELASINASIISRFQNETVRHVGPAFSASRLVGGADADAVYGRSLVELKTSKSLYPANVRDALRQAIAYVLLDTYEEFSVSHIEIWFSRQAYNLQIAVDQIVDDLRKARKEVKEDLISLAIKNSDASKNDPIPDKDQDRVIDEITTTSESPLISSAEGKKSLRKGLANFLTRVTRSSH
jgi:hypothetical protein